jgi:phosphoglycolate phosphatase-like HAD superfamily hydrolase
MCISQTPVDALQREWGENQLDGYIAMIAGQEMGTKTEHLKFAAASKYEATRILMIGDAPGDFKAAKSNFALFYPINPGHEEASWQRLFDEALDKFFNEEFAGAYEDALVAEFNQCLPENPPWVI